MLANEDGGLDDVERVRKARSLSQSHPIGSIAYLLPERRRAINSGSYKRGTPSGKRMRALIEGDYPQAATHRWRRNGVRVLEGLDACERSLPATIW